MTAVDIDQICIFDTLKKIRLALNQTTGVHIEPVTRAASLCSDIAVG
jgi:hypothetical protein